jgi:ABC-type transport system involved in cytochrome c biogenesis permease subunit
MPDPLLLATRTETQFYLAHLFFLLATVGAYAFPRGRRVARAAWLLALGSLLGSALVRSLAAGRLPMATMYEFGLMMGLVLTVLVLVADLRLDARVPAQALAGATFVLASVQLLFFQEARPLMPALKSWWLTAHVLTAVVAYGLLAGSCVLALVGLLRKGAGDSVAAMVNRLVFLAFPFLTLLIITGAIWAEYAWGAFWRWDPKETWALITWLSYLGYLHLVTARRWTGRRVLWLAVAGFAVVVFTFYGVNLLLSGLHSYA